MTATVVLLLALAALASSAPTDKSCCGPSQWESLVVATAAYGYNLATSKQISGSLSVDHDHGLAALYLLSQGEDMNMTMTVSVNSSSSSMLIYFIARNVQANQQQTCTSYILKNVVTDLTSSCFPADNTVLVDRMTAHFDRSPRVLGSLPVNLLAYDYAGLAGLCAAQMFADADNCNPVILGLSSAADNGPRMSVMMTSAKVNVPELSAFELPSICSEADTQEIDLPKTIAIANRRESRKISRESSDESNDWIEEMVMAYAVDQLVPNSGERFGRSYTIDLDEALEGTTAEVIKNAAVLRELLENLNEFIGPVDSSVTNDTNSDGSSVDIEELVKLMIEHNIISRWRDNRDRDGDRSDDRDGAWWDNDRSQSSLDIGDVELLVKLMQRRDRWNGDGESQLQQLIVAVSKMQMSKNLVDAVLHHYLVSELENGRRPDRSELKKLVVLSTIADQQNGLDVSTLLKIMALQQWRND